jgi:hypothetical protein
MRAEGGAEVGGASVRAQPTPIPTPTGQDPGEEEEEEEKDRRRMPVQEARYADTCHMRRRIHAHHMRRSMPV